MVDVVGDESLADAAQSREQEAENAGGRCAVVGAEETAAWLHPPGSRLSRGAAISGSVELALAWEMVQISNKIQFIAQCRTDVGCMQRHASILQRVWVHTAGDRLTWAHCLHQWHQPHKFALNTALSCKFVSASEGDTLRDTH